MQDEILSVDDENSFASLIIGEYTEQKIPNVGIEEPLTERLGTVEDTQQDESTPRLVAERCYSTDWDPMQ